MHMSVHVCVHTHILELENHGFNNTGTILRALHALTHLIIITSYEENHLVTLMLEMGNGDFERPENLFEVVRLVSASNTY